MLKTLKSIEVIVVFKGYDLINGNAAHFITFEDVNTKERVYLQVGIGNFMMLCVGDHGILNYKEAKSRAKSKFVSFERAVYPGEDSGLEPVATTSIENSDAELEDTQVLEVVEKEEKEEEVA